MCLTHHVSNHILKTCQSLGLSTYWLFIKENPGGDGIDKTKSLTGAVRMGLAHFRVFFDQVTTHEALGITLITILQNW